MLLHGLYNEGLTMRGSHGLEELLVLRAEALQAAIVRQPCQHLSSESWCEIPGRPVPCLCSRRGAAASGATESLYCPFWLPLDRQHTRHLGAAQQRFRAAQASVRVQ